MGTGRAGRSYKRTALGFQWMSDFADGSIVKTLTDPLIQGQRSLLDVPIMTCDSDAILLKALLLSISVHVLIGTWHMVGAWGVG